MRDNAVSNVPSGGGGRVEWTPVRAVIYGRPLHMIKVAASSAPQAEHYIY